MSIRTALALFCLFASTSAQATSNTLYITCKKSSGDGFSVVLAPHREQFEPGKTLRIWGSFLFPDRETGAFQLGTMYFNDMTGRSSFLYGSGERKYEHTYIGGEKERVTLNRSNQTIEAKFPRAGMNPSQHYLRIQGTTGIYVGARTSEDLENCVWKDAE